jgi:hypothetical protein
VRRTRLVWLTLGIAVGLVAAMIPGLISNDGVIYLQVERPWDDLLPNQPENALASKSDDEQVRSVVHDAWRCGARNFEVEMPTHVYKVRIPIETNNLKAINCLVADKEGAASDLIFLVSKSK